MTVNDRERGLHDKRLYIQSVFAQTAGACLKKTRGKNTLLHLELLRAVVQKLVSLLTHVDSNIQIKIFNCLLI